MKKIINRILEQDIDLSEDIDEVIALLLSFKEKYPDFNLRLINESDYDVIRFSLVGERSETDKEYNDRLKQQEAKKIAHK